MLETSLASDNPHCCFVTQQSSVLLIAEMPVYILVLPCLLNCCTKDK